MENFQDLLNSIQWDTVWSLVSRIVAVLLCLTVHETCHGLAAYALGDPTAKRMNRLSFNPLHHIDWFGLAAMLVAGFGWAKPVPVDSRYFRKPKSGMALCALAGPASNFLLAVLAMLPVRWMYFNAQATQVNLLLFDFLTTLVILNLGLGLFNLIPIPPLDGSKILFSLLPDRAYGILMRYERYGMIVLLILVALGIGDGVLSRGIWQLYQGLWKLMVL